MTAEKQIEKDEGDGTATRVTGRGKRLLLTVGVCVAAGVAAWAIAAGLISAASSGRIHTRATVDALPHARAAVVLGCVKVLPNGLNNLYFLRRIAAAAELYRSGKVDCLIVSGDNHIKGYDEATDMKEALV